MNAKEEKIRYNFQMEQSWIFQDFVSHECWKAGIFIHLFQSKKYQHIGEGITGVEVKEDKKYEETGNIYIEYAEKTRSCNADYVPSGVMRTDNTWLWIIGNKKVLFFFSQRQLKKFVEKAIVTKSKWLREIPTSKGLLLPQDKIETFAIHILYPEHIADKDSV